MPFLTQGPEGEKSPYGVNKTNWKFLPFLLAILIAGVIGVLIWRLEVYQTIKWLMIEEKIKEPEELFEDETANWKTYRNEEYGFEMKYPNNWIRPDQICDRNPFCLYLTDYSKLPEREDIEVCFEIEPDECTKEGFNSYRNALLSGKLPAGLSEEVWRLVKLDEKNAIQRIYYNIYTGHYLIETRVFTDDVRILLMAILPIQPFYKDELVLGHPVVDIEKSQSIEEDLRNGLFPNEETQNIVSQYNQMLSTFRFLE